MMGGWLALVNAGGAIAHEKLAATRQRIEMPATATW
jgi:hypothetical protein